MGRNLKEQTKSDAAPVLFGLGQLPQASIEPKPRTELAVLGIAADYFMYPCSR